MKGRQYQIIPFFKETNKEVLSKIKLSRFEYTISDFVTLFIINILKLMNGLDPRHVLFKSGDLRFFK